MNAQILMLEAMERWYTAQHDGGVMAVNYQEVTAVNLIEYMREWVRQYNSANNEQ